LTEETVPAFIDGHFVRDRIDDQRSVIAVPRDHFFQLSFCILQGSGVFPLNGPVDWDFSPYENSDLVGHAQHRFVMRPVGPQASLCGAWLQLT
jgi:hypothetical protein